MKIFILSLFKCYSFFCLFLFCNLANAVGGSCTIKLDSGSVLAAQSCVHWSLHDKNAVVKFKGQDICSVAASQVKEDKPVAYKDPDVAFFRKAAFQINARNIRTPEIINQLSELGQSDVMIELRNDESHSRLSSILTSEDFLWKKSKVRVLAIYTNLISPRYFIREGTKFKKVRWTEINWPACKMVQP